MTNNKGNEVNNNSTTSSSDNKYEWESYEPVTVESDKDLQAALNGDQGETDMSSRDLNFNATSWDGMESGAVKYDSTQAQDWYANVPKKYMSTARRWANQQGMMRITPIQQRQKFTYSTVAYIASKTEEPKTQTFPISDVNVTPHQITFDFYDTTEGRVGVSNAVEKHMSVECDVYLTDLLAQFWIFGNDNNNVMGADIFKSYKREWWNAVETNTYLSFEGDLEATPEFADFRNTFLQQHSGWVCRFSSHAFGVFNGVITDVSYNIGSGESFAKWHLKFEEAIFTSNYSKDGQKEQADAGTSEDGSTENSGAADDSEKVTT
jgi:hypothetical protein